MGEVNIILNDKAYGMACDDGQEGRVSDLGRYIDSRLRDIASAGAASSESHLLVLTAMVLADEIFELREILSQWQTQKNVPQRVSEEEERHIIHAINHLALRIDYVAERLKQAA